MAEATTAAHDGGAAPHPGVRSMPQWQTGELVDAPTFRLRNWAALIGPGLVMGGAAIGGGEWLTGPVVTAKYGGGLLWLATLSILGQVIYNLEISRYALYSGEPIFTGKFRTPPGPLFWLTVYLVLDFGSVFPYLAANASIPVATLILGALPDPEHVPAHRYLIRGLSYVIFLGALVPLLVGGKVYNSLKVVMSFKIAVVLSFLLLTALLFSHPATWKDILTGFVRFGTVPVRVSEAQSGPAISPDQTAAAEPPDAVAESGGSDEPSEAASVHLDNIFVSLWQGRGFPAIDFTLIGFIAAMVAIAGSGGLTNTPISNYTRDQGWGMGWHVGAIPSVFGGRNIQLSHVGCVFLPTAENLPRWRRWYRHVMRDQLAVWMPACFVGLALPCVLSVEFLPRGTRADNWTAAAMTAGAVRDHVGATVNPSLGQAFWFMTLFCGFLVLGPSVASSADGLIRRWVDVLWTASPKLRQVSPQHIGKVYFRVVLVFACFGLIMLSLNSPTQLLRFATLVMNFALGFSCWHALAVNVLLLPRELRPNWFMRLGLVAAGAFFSLLATVALLDQLGFLTRWTSSPA